MMINFAYLFYYVAVKPHTGGQTKFVQEFHNELMIVILCYHLFIFSDFMPILDKKDNFAIYYMGYSFVFCIVEILVVNIIIIFYKSIKSEILDRKKERRQNEYVQRYRYFENTLKTLYVDKTGTEIRKMCAIYEKERNNVPFKGIDEEYKKYLEE